MTQWLQEEIVDASVKRLDPSHLPEETHGALVTESHVNIHELHPFQCQGAPQSGALKLGTNSEVNIPSGRDLTAM
jgi:hypothetical protein